MSTGSVSAVGQQTSQASDAYNAWGNVNLDDFIGLLITQMQNQDPLEPMKNEEILQQISQIREIESNARLTETLESVLLGQNVATASSLLGRTITGLNDSSQIVTGQVDRVSIAEGKPLLHVGEDTVALKNVSEILPENNDNPT
jgi:flagellar basal-body rod modification protein FlgD